MMTKVAALYIATGKYTVFWPEFYESAEQYLLRDCEVHYFVFTDAATLPGEENPRVHICPQEAYSWPFATLRRFEIFLKQEQALRGFDYIFFFNANAQFMQPVTREMLLPRAEKGERLLVVQHPSFYAKPNYEFTYDRNPRSTACIPYGLGKYYVCGVDIHHQVELKSSLWIIRSTDPDYCHSLCDFRLHQKCGCNICDSALACDV